MDIGRFFFKYHRVNIHWAKFHLHNVVLFTGLYGNLITHIFQKLIKSTGEFKIKRVYKSDVNFRSKINTIQTSNYQTN